MELLERDAGRTDGVRPVSGVHPRLRSDTDGAQNLPRERHLVSAPAHRLGLVQLHHLHRFGGSGVEKSDQQVVHRRLFRVSGGALRLVVHLLQFQIAEMHPHQDPQEPVCFVHRQQRPVDRVVRRHGDASSPLRQRAGLSNSARRSALLSGLQLLLDVLRRPLSPHHTRRGFRRQSRHHEVALRHRMGGTGRLHRHLRRRPKLVPDRDRALLDQRQPVLVDPDRPRLRLHAGQSDLLSEHRASAGHQVARGAFFGHRSNQKGGPGHHHIDPTPGTSLSGHSFPSGGRRSGRTRLRHRVGHRHFLSGSLRFAALLFLQRRDHSPVPQDVVSAPLAIG